LGGPLVFDTLGTGWNRIYSADFNTDFNGASGTVAGWFKMYNPWNDANARYFATLKVDASNYTYIRKEAVSGELGFWYNSGGTLLGRVQTGMTTTDWFHAAIVFSDVTNNSLMKAYLNGSQVSTTQTPAGTWAGNLFTDTTVLGVGYTVGPADPADCAIGPWAVWNSELTDQQIAYLAGV
jgi:hypothetical protein